MDDALRLQYSSHSRRHPKDRSRSPSHRGQLQRFLHCPRDAFNLEVRLALASIRTAPARRLPSSVHTLLQVNFVAPMVLHKIEFARASSDLPSQC